MGGRSLCFASSKARLFRHCALALTAGLLTWAGIAILAPELHAQATPDSSLGKPSAKDQVVEVVRGQSIQIILNTASKSPNAKLEFSKGDLPFYGTILERIPTVDPRTPTRAVVTYRSNPDSTAAADTFTWTARYLENNTRGHYSAPGRVTIRIRDPAPLLEMSEQVYFGQTVIGSETVKELYLKNVGNAPFRTQLKLEPPWRVVKPENPDFTLNPGGQTKLEIGFRPQKQGSSTFNWRLLASKGGDSMLTGSGLLPFRPDQTSVTLQYQAETRTRTAALSLYGLAPDGVTIKVVTDTRLETPSSESVTVSSGEKKPVTLSLPVSDTRPYEGNVTLQSGGFSTQVKVSADATPAHLEVEMLKNATVVDFGEVVPGISLSHPFRLKNLGGSDATVEITLPPPFELLSPDSSNVLRPGTSRDYNVLFSTKEGSPSAVHRAELNIQSGKQQLSYQVNAIVRAPEIPTPAATNSQPRTTSLPSMGNLPQVRNPLPSLPTPMPPPIADENDDRRTPLGFITEDLEERQYSNRVQPVPTFELVEQRRRGLKIGWPLPSPSQRQFVVDMRQSRFNTETGAIDSVWTAWPDTEFFIDDDGLTVAEVRGLQPNTIYELRVVSVTDDGRYAPPSEAFAIITAMPIDWTWFERIVILCGLALAGWFGWRFYVSRQA